MKNCNHKHKWIRKDKDSLVLECEICGKKADQAVAALPLPSGYLTDCGMSGAGATAAAPLLREKITIHTGKNAVGTIEVYKDDIEKELYKALYEPLYIGLNSATD